MYQEPKQSKVIYINTILDDEDKIVGFTPEYKDVYLNEKMGLHLSFNEMKFDTKQLRFFVGDNIGPIDYEEYKSRLYKETVLEVDRDTKITVADENYEFKCVIDIFKI